MRVVGLKVLKNRLSEYVSGTGLSSITSSNLTRIEGNSSGLSISANTMLTDISALSTITYVEGVLNILNNPELCVPDWVDEIDVGGGRTVSGNKECS